MTWDHEMKDFILKSSIQCLNICPIITCVKIWDGASPNACGCNIQDSSERCRKAAWACHDLRWVSNKLCYIMLDSVTLDPKNHCFHLESLKVTLFIVFRCCLKRPNLRHCTKHQWPINLFNVQNLVIPVPFCCYTFRIQREPEQTDDICVSWLSGNWWDSNLCCLHVHSVWVQCRIWTQCL